MSDTALATSDTRTVSAAGLRGLLETYGTALFVVATIILMAGSGLIAILKFSEHERVRDVQAWYTRLGTLADGRAAAINRWVEAQFMPLVRISDNQAVQLYASEILEQQGSGEGMAETAYLTNLLVVTAHQNGFFGTPVGPQVPANVQRLGVAGMAILTMEGAPIAATPEMPPLDEEWKKFVAAIPRGERAIRDIYLAASGIPAMGFAVPLYRVQGNAMPSEQIGVILGIKEVADEVYPLLKEPDATIENEEAILVRRSGGLVEFISPTMGNPKPFTRTEAFDPGLNASSFAVSMPGSAALRRDYRGQEVLVTGRQLARLPWVLVEKVDRNVALEESDSRTTRLTIFMVLVLVAVLAVLVGLWRHGASVRARRATDQYRAVADQLRKQEALLELVTDTVPDQIFLANVAGQLAFVNKAGADRLGVAKADLQGKSIASAFGPAEAKAHERRGQDSVEAGTILTDTDRRDGSKPRVVQARYIPLPETGAKEDRSFLVVETDITDVVAAREKQARTLRQLVDALVSIVEQRDPTSVHQSERVAVAAAALGKEMDLEPVLVETVAVASRLANFGKVLLPEALLVKTGALDDKERDIINRVHLTSADFLAGIDFDGPVVATLRQIQERYDGTGQPEGLAGDDILITAQIIALSNAFVAMLSDRPYRKRLDLDDALKILLGQSSKAYSPRVVMALGSYIENHGGRAEWSDPTRATATA